MAFGNIGAVAALAPGASTTWTFDFGGADRGVQLGFPDVKASGNGPTHIAFSHGKRKDGNGFTSYSVVIQNVGNQTGFHNLQGGGLV